MGQHDVARLLQRDVDELVLVSVLFHEPVGFELGVERTQVPLLVLQAVLKRHIVELALARLRPVGVVEVDAVEFGFALADLACDSPSRRRRWRFVPVSEASGFR